MCEWVEDEDGIWHTSCQHTYEIITGTPRTNGMKFCPFCGDQILTIVFVLLED